MVMRKWRIYYADGRTNFDDANGTPYDAPARGVICVVYPHPDQGRYILHRKDYYWWSGDEWNGGDIFGLWDYLIEPGPKTVKFGRTVADNRYRAIYNLANEDPDFPLRSATSPDEKL